MVAPDLFTTCSECVARFHIEKEVLDNFKALTTIYAVLHLTTDGLKQYCNEFRRMGLPLHEAAKTDEPALICQIAKITGLQFLGIGDRSGRTAMHEAAFYGNAAALKALVAVGAEFNAIYPSRGSYLSVLDEALRQNKMDCAVFLRRQGAESFLLQEGGGENAAHRSRLEEVDRLAAAEDQRCADALYDTPNLRRVPADVLDLVGAYAKTAPLH